MKVSKKSRLTAKQLFKACAAQGTLDENHVRQVVRRLLEGQVCALSVPDLHNVPRLFRLATSLARASIDGVTGR